MKTALRTEQQPLAPVTLTRDALAGTKAVLADMKARGMKPGDWLDDQCVIHRAKAVCAAPFKGETCTLLVGHSGKCTSGRGTQR